MIHYCLQVSGPCHGVTSAPCQSCMHCCREEKKNCSLEQLLSIRCLQVCDTNRTSPIQTTDYSSFFHGSPLLHYWRFVEAAGSQIIVVSIRTCLPASSASRIRTKFKRPLTRAACLTCKNFHWRTAVQSYCSLFKQKKKNKKKLSQAMNNWYADRKDDTFCAAIHAAGRDHHG